MERMEKDGEFRKGVISMKSQRDELILEVKEISESKNKIIQEYTKTKEELISIRKEVDGVNESYRLSKQAVEAGKQAVDEAVGRIGKIMKEREGVTSDRCCVYVAAAGPAKVQKLLGVPDLPRGTVQHRRRQSLNYWRAGISLMRYKDWCLIQHQVTQAQTMGPVS